MAGGFESFAGPSYITSRSADVILSDVRPIKLKLEALRSMNVLLDEFLYKILQAAGSLFTDQLKAGLNKILPSSLGKEAVLEAELELKSYWERNTPHKPAAQEFDLQWSFELLRLKCEAYSTMNDTDEDSDAEKRLNERMMNAGGAAPPHISLMAPAALYLTAILEHVCQHVLSNVSRVAARDSSRTLATVQDLFVALCEDASIYTTFKSMKVYEQIDTLSKAQKPRRTPSRSQSIDKSLPGRAGSPFSDISTPRESMSMSSRLRVSSESNGTSAIFAQLGNGRASGEKSRIKLFGTRSSSDHDARSGTPEIGDGDGKNSGSFELMDEAALQEFDELMRSSTTMKVSLTPDRLKSMEVYKQEKRRTKAVDVENDPFLTVVNPEVKRAVSGRRAQARLVDAITEDDEPSPIIKAQPAPPPSAFQSVIAPRARQASLTNASPLPTMHMNAPPRTRSVTISAPQVLHKKKSFGQRPSVSAMTSAILSPKRDNALPPAVQNGRPPRTRKVARNRESLDLDEVMGGEDDESISPLASPPMTPARRVGSKPYISKTARDLIDFLDEGPPTELQPPTINASMVSLAASSKSRSGRLHRMVSRLTLGGSSEKLNGRSSLNTLPDTPEIRRGPYAGLNGLPQAAYVPASISSGRPMPAVVVATPPPPPGTYSPSISGSSSQNGRVPFSVDQERSDSPNQSSSYRRVSVTRKAVPAWDGEFDGDTQSSRQSHSQGSPVHTTAPTSPSSSTSAAIAVVTSSSSPHSPVEKPHSERSRKSSSPLDAFPPVPPTINGHIQRAADATSMRGETSSIRTDYYPIGSPVGSVPSSPSTSLRYPPSKQTSLRTGSVRSVPGVVTTTNGSSMILPTTAERLAFSPSPPRSPSPTEPHILAYRSDTPETHLSYPEQQQKAGAYPVPSALPLPASNSTSVPGPVLTRPSAIPDPDRVEESQEEADDEEEEGEADPSAALPATTSTSGPLHASVRSGSASPGGFTADDAHDLRRLLSVATTAEECKLLVDMFLTRSGFPKPPSPYEIYDEYGRGHAGTGTKEDDEDVKEPLLPDVQEEAAKIEKLNEELERNLVMLYLGWSEDESSASEDEAANSVSATPA